MRTDDLMLRVQLVALMDTYIREIIGDDDLTDKWLMYGMPDGETPDELMYDIQDDETFVEWVSQFKSILVMNHKANEGGKK